MARGGRSNGPQSLTPADTMMCAPAGARLSTSWQVEAETASHVWLPPSCKWSPCQHLHTLAARLRVRVQTIWCIISSTSSSDSSVTRKVMTAVDGRTGASVFGRSGTLVMSCARGRKEHRALSAGNWEWRTHLKGSYALNCLSREPPSRLDRHQSLPRVFYGAGVCVPEYSFEAVTTQTSDLL